MDANSNPSINLLPLKTIISTATTTRSTLTFTLKSTPDYDPLTLDSHEFYGPYGLRRSYTEKSPIGSSQRPMPSLDDDQWRRLRSNSYNEYSTVMKRLATLCIAAGKMLMRTAPSDAPSPMYFYIPVLAGVIMSTVLYMMNPDNNQAFQQPPRYNPDDCEQSFRSWMTDLMHWCMATRLAPHEQAVAIVRRLEGTARQMGRMLTPEDLFHGGVINGEYLDPVTYVVA